MTAVQRFLASAGIAAVPVASVCVFATLAIFAGNSDEFSVSFVEILRRLLPSALSIIAVLGLFGLVMKRRGLSRYWSVLAALGILVWLQGNILVWDYGVFDGRDIEWLAAAWRGVVDLGLWIGLLAIACRRHDVLRQPLVYGALAAAAIQIAAAVPLAVGNALAPAPGEQFAGSAEDREAALRFSADRNVLHIVMDGFQTDIFEDIVNDPRYASIMEELQGFTLYRDNLGAYPYTQLSVPALLSGKLYRNEVPVDDFIDTALRGDTILAVAETEGYEVDIAAPVALANIYARANHTHAYGITHSDHVSRDDYVANDAAKLIDLALFRVVPHFAKALVYRDELWLFQSQVRSAAYLRMQYFSDLRFLDQLAAKMTAGRDTPVYKMMHLMLSHRPTVGNALCEYDGKHSTNRETVTRQARCGLLRVVEVLRRMKSLGIYDKSLVVLMADHGAWVPVEGFSSPGEDVNALTVAMATPVLAVKLPGASGDFAVSNAPTSVIDVPATIAAAIGADAEFPGVPAFLAGRVGSRSRVHMIYGYGINPQSEGYLRPMQEFSVAGGVFDGSAWQTGDRHLPGGMASAEE